MANSIDRVLASAVEGQAQSPRFVQSQLSSLHAALKKEGPAIRATIESESRHTTAEIQIQYALALEAVAALFAESNLEKALEVEYWLARRENSLSHSVAYPLAYILPSSYNFFNACVTAVAAAIAAGSCVILEVRHDRAHFTILPFHRHAGSQDAVKDLRTYADDTNSSS